MIGVCCSCPAGISTHLCLSMYKNTAGGGCIGLYEAELRWEHNGVLDAPLWGLQYFSNNLPSMCLSLLDQSVRARLSGKGRQAESCQLACEAPAHLEGLLALCECVFMCVCLRDRDGSNKTMPTRETV